MQPLHYFHVCECEFIYMDDISIIIILKINSLHATQFCARDTQTSIRTIFVSIFRHKYLPDLDVCMYVCNALYKLNDRIDN